MSCVCTALLKLGSELYCLLLFFFLWSLKNLLSGLGSSPASVTECSSDGLPAPQTPSEMSCVCTGRLVKRGSELLFACICLSRVFENLLSGLASSPGSVTDCSSVAGPSTPKRPRA